MPERSLIPLPVFNGVTILSCYVEYRHGCTYAWLQGRKRRVYFHEQLRVFSLSVQPPIFVGL